MWWTTSGLSCLSLSDDRGQKSLVVGERVVLDRHLLHAELLLGPLARGLGDALAVGGVLGEERDACIWFGFRLKRGARCLAMNSMLYQPKPVPSISVRNTFLSPRSREARVHAGGLPVDDVLARGRLARRAAQGRGVRPGDDLDALAGDEAVGLARRRGRVRRVAHHEDELLAHDAAALVDQVAHDLVALEVPLALDGERAGERLEHRRSCTRP